MSGQPGEWWWLPEAEQARLDKWLAEQSPVEAPKATPQEPFGLFDEVSEWASGTITAPGAVCGPMRPIYDFLPRRGVERGEISFTWTPPGPYSPPAPSGVRARAGAVLTSLCHRVGHWLLRDIEDDGDDW